MHPLVLFKVLLLLMVANGTPVIAKRIFGARFAQPLDGGLSFIDGRPLFGPSKTIRGVVLAVIATSIAAPVLGIDAAIGFVAAASAMAGDLVSSFIKRRLALASSSRATGLDQIPESLFALLACSGPLALSVADIVAGVAIFLAGEILLSRLLFQIRLRDRPY